MILLLRFNSACIVRFDSHEKLRGCIIHLSDIIFLYNNIILIIFYRILLKKIITYFKLIFYDFFKMGKEQEKKEQTVKI